jgi:hypothetical protein
VAPRDHSDGPSAAEEGNLVERLRAGDEQAFEALVECCSGTMLAIAGSLRDDARRDAPALAVCDA